jgi:hypothetical protein
MCVRIYSSEYLEDGWSENLSRRLHGRSEINDERHRARTADLPLCLTIMQGRFYRQLSWNVPTDAQSLCDKMSNPGHHERNTVFRTWDGVEMIPECNFVLSDGG